MSLFKAILCKVISNHQFKGIFLIFSKLNKISSEIWTSNENSAGDNGVHYFMGMG